MSFHNVLKLRIQNEWSPGNLKNDPIWDGMRWDGMKWQLLKDVMGWDEVASLQRGMKCWDGAGWFLRLPIEWTQNVVKTSLFITL